MKAKVIWVLPDVEPGQVKSAVVKEVTLGPNQFFVYNGGRVAGPGETVKVDLWPDGSWVVNVK